MIIISHMLNPLIIDLTIVERNC